MTKSLEASLQRTLRYGNFEPPLTRYLKVANKLLTHCADEPCTAEPLHHAYLRRSLDVTENSAQFMALAALAPELAHADSPLRRFARRQYSSGDRFRSVIFDLMTAHHGWFSIDSSAGKDARHYLEPAFRSVPGIRHLEINANGGILWFSRERYGDFLFRMYAVALIGIHAESTNPGPEEARLFGIIGKWTEARHSSLYQVEKLLRCPLLNAPA